MRLPRTNNTGKVITYTSSIQARIETAKRMKREGYSLEEILQVTSLTEKILIESIDWK